MSIVIQQQDRIQVIAINRPQARNAVDRSTSEALFDAFLQFDANPTAAVAILTGDHTSFCAGYDLKGASLGLNADWQAQYDIPTNWVNPTTQPLPSPMGPARLRLSKPVIAAVEGAAVAGGLELALWCDLRVASQSAFFGVYCRRWGVPLIDGGTVRLPQIVGQGRANDMILSGRKVTAAEALQMGLINQICDEGTALEHAIAYAENVLRFPQGCLIADHHAARQAPTDLALALKQEWQSVSIFFQEGISGAARFSAGKGRGGNFSDI